MGEEQGFFQPTEMEVDRSSKLSLLEHISYRLRRPDRLDHSDNGHLDGGQMLELTKAVISESEGYDSKDSKAMKEHLKHLYQKVLDQKEVRLSFINTKKIEDVKTEARTGHRSLPGLRLRGRSPHRREKRGYFQALHGGDTRLLSIPGRPL